MSPGEFEPRRIQDGRGDNRRDCERELSGKLLRRDRLFEVAVDRITDHEQKADQHEKAAVDRIADHEQQ